MRRCASRWAPRSIRPITSSKRAMAWSTPRGGRFMATVASSGLEHAERRVRRRAGEPVLLDPFGAGDIAAALLDLAAQGVDRLLHVAERLDLEFVDRVHRVVDVLEGALQHVE